PATVVLAAAHVADESGPGHQVPVTDAAWLAEREVGEVLRFTDGRGPKRKLLVTDILAEDEGPARVVAELRRTAYFRPGLRLLPDGGGDAGTVAELPARAGFHVVRVREQIVLTRSLEPGVPVPGGPHRIGCTLGQVFDDAAAGQRISFDDGRISGVITAVFPDRLEIEVTSAGADGVKLRPEKGINLPDTHLGIPALTDEDRAALPFIVEHADLVNYSFVRDEGDVAELFDRVTALGRDDLAVVLKIETVEAFRNLPQLLLEAMRWREVGVMIARGDLAVEAGFERLAEVQEEILWLCEAAHIPVIWATQVLESLAKKGLATRAEVTDAAMSMRAECVMLNKGPHIVEAIRFLHDVLQRMQAHLSKKQTLLRRLRSWDLQAWGEQH
ncbi:pyruvate kinase, partial [Tessaracoccus lubricantis]